MPLGSQFQAATTEFWSYIFKEKIFVGPDFSIAPESPPTEDDLSDRRRVDLVVKKWRPSRGHKKGKFGALLLFEAKRYSATQVNIETLERQAFTASIAWLIENVAEEAYSMTVIGATARLCYIAAASNEADELWKGFETILRYPQGLPESQVQILASNTTPPHQPAGLSEGERIDYGTHYDAPGASDQKMSYDEADVLGDVGYGELSGQHGATGSAHYEEGYHEPDDTMGGPSYAENSPKSPGLDDEYSSMSAPANDGGEPTSAASALTNAIPEFPSNAQHVEVKLRIDAGGRHLYSYKHGGRKRETEWHNWEKRTTYWNGALKECYLDPRQGGQQFWTWTLHPAQVPTVDERARGKGRA
ncbi:uncharacterized protein LY89DRAFT_737158 [Mollisia scopiformis]|uniref:Uncharacterized protein n=1 Tax=Mollisia scopiformis TaxID=149040 RepID=A0A194WYZ8_MOLSC|nr:uncharacterized protein LY89DRAFT_737158 [Mollisia scopiformis]KUJ13175.1 hypothetical protein LY89DRAFT_737158 [Mollisia scopiformis]